MGTKSHNGLQGLYLNSKYERSLSSNFLQVTQHLLKFSAFLAVCALLFESPGPFQDRSFRAWAPTERCSSVTLVQGQLLFESLNFTSFLSWPWYGLHMPFHSLKPLQFITFNTVALRGLIKEMEDSSPCDARPLLALPWTGTEQHHEPQAGLGSTAPAVGSGTVASPLNCVFSCTPKTFLWT